MNMKHVLVSALAALMLAPAAASAQAINQDKVSDRTGQPVWDSRGNCVRTKWVSAEDPCSAVAPAAPARREVSRINKEERTVYFDFNKSNVKASERGKLDSLVRTIKNSREVESVDIVGFADRIGTNSYNDRLSQKRAEAVKAYLWNSGVKTRKIDLRAMGENGSVTKCGENLSREEKIACLAADRRVEIELNFIQ